MIKIIPCSATVVLASSLSSSGDFEKCIVVLAKAIEEVCNVNVIAGMHKISMDISFEYFKEDDGILIDLNDVGEEFEKNAPEGFVLKSIY